MFGILMIIAFILYVWLATWTVRKVADKCESNRGKWGAKIAVILAFILIPTGDSIVGHIYFNHLCETEAGAKVYQTIELPAEYWDGDGKPRFMNSRGVLDTRMLGNRFDWQRETKHVVSNLIRIDKEKWVLYDNQSNKELGEMVDFTRYFGWMNIFSPAPNVAEGCQNIWTGKHSQRNFMLQILTAPVNASGVENGIN